MKDFKWLVFVGVWSFCSGSYANQVSHVLPLHAKGVFAGHSGASLVTLNIHIAKEFNNSGTVVAEYAGTSQDQACSDLHFLRSFAVEEAQTNPAGDFIDYWDSKDMAFAFEPGLTCIKVEFIIPRLSGKTYSLGPIQLKWDAESQQYTAATPNTVSLQLP